MTFVIFYLQKLYFNKQLSKIHILKISTDQNWDTLCNLLQLSQIFLLLLT